MSTYQHCEDNKQKKAEHDDEMSDLSEHLQVMANHFLFSMSMV